MEREFKKMTHLWSNCILLATGDEVIECVVNAYWFMAASEYSFLTYKDQLGVGQGFYYIAVLLNTFF